MKNYMYLPTGLHNLHKKIKVFPVSSWFESRDIAQNRNFCLWIATILNFAHKIFFQWCQAGTQLNLIQDSPEMQNPQNKTKHALVQNGLLATGLPWFGIVSLIPFPFNLEVGTSHISIITPETKYYSVVLTLSHSWTFLFYHQFWLQRLRV